MATVEILPVSDTDGNKSYRAVFRGGTGSHAESMQSSGKTAGQALDALTAQLDQADFNALLVIQNAAPDSFFSAKQQSRLSQLMEQWRVARDGGKTLSPEQQTELDELVEAELKAATARTAELLMQQASS